MVLSQFRLVQEQDDSFDGANTHVSARVKRITRLILPRLNETTISRLVTKFRLIRVNILVIETMGLRIVDR